VRSVSLFIGLVLAPASLAGQVVSQPLCGSPLLPDSSELHQIMTGMLAKHPEIAAKRFSGHVAWDVGAIDTFFVYNFVTRGFDQVPAELRAVGTMSLVWVSQSELQNGHVDSLVVQTLLESLETKTPGTSRDSTRGVLDLTRQLFGEPPNINSDFVKGGGDGRTHFLLCDIQDGWTSSSPSYIAGFFYSIDVSPSGSVSNRRDLLYIDTYPGIFLDGVRDAERPLGTLSHEFQHLIHWNYDPNEIPFFNEGLSELSTYICGYGLRSPGLYLENPNVAFLGWNSTLEDYSRAALWALYLLEQCGDAFISAFTQNPSQGAGGFNGAASAVGIPALLTDVVRSFHIANVVRDRTVNSSYGYINAGLVGSGPVFLKAGFSAYAAGERTALQPFAADYVRLFAPETLDVTLSVNAGSISGTAMEIRGNAKQIVSLPTGVPYVSVFGGPEYSEAILIIFNQNSGTNASYTYASAGVSKQGIAVELRNDDGASHSLPNALFLSGDTAYAAFDPIDGGRIDSVAFWFASTGSGELFFRDWNANYDLTLQPFGGLAGGPRMSGSPIVFSVSDTGFFKTVVPVADRNVRSSPGFVVQLIYGPGAPNPLLRRDGGQTRLRSYLYLRQEPTSGRRMYSSLGDFYVRVYLSATNEPPPPPPPVIPVAFALHQNYPNPFNPLTTISYEVPSRAEVRLTLHDLLGREIMVLREGLHEPDFHTVELDGSRLTSGVYFVRMKTPQGVLVRKIVLLR